MLKILPYLRLCVEKNASDLYFTANAPAMLRIEGEMLAIGKTLMTSEFVQELANSILTPEQQETFARHSEIDLASQAGGLGRFRVNVFRQRGAVSRGDLPRRLAGRGA